MQRLAVPQGEFALERYPSGANSTLRAWDAADELLLHHLAEHQEPASDPAWLVLNDSFGALAAALSAG